MVFRKEFTTMLLFKQRMWLEQVLSLYQLALWQLLRLNRHLSFKLSVRAQLKSLWDGLQWLEQQLVDLQSRVMRSSGRHQVTKHTISLAKRRLALSRRQKIFRHPEACSTLRSSPSTMQDVVLTHLFCKWRQLISQARCKLQLRSQLMKVRSRLAGNHQVTQATVILQATKFTGMKVVIRIYSRVQFMTQVRVVFWHLRSLLLK